jgi:hypothetical protein
LAPPSSGSFSASSSELSPDSEPSSDSAPADDSPLSASSASAASCSASSNGPVVSRFWISSPVLLRLVLAVQDREGAGADRERREPDDDQRHPFAGEVVVFQPDQADDDGRGGQDAATDEEERFVHRAAGILLVQGTRCLPT